MVSLITFLIFSIENIGAYKKTFETSLSNSKKSVSINSSLNQDTHKKVFSTLIIRF